MEVLSSEWWLTRKGYANGGGIILLRALVTTLYLYFFVLLARNIIDPTRAWAFSLHELRLQIVETLPWFGAIFAATHFGFYNRFASQWTYLAELYNQIKATEVSDNCNVETLAEWKAGFAEDAEELHLATKPLIASVLRTWLMDERVKHHFIHNAPGGEERWKALTRRVDSAFDQRAKEVAQLAK